MFPGMEGGCCGHKWSAKVTFRKGDDINLMEAGWWEPGPPLYFQGGDAYGTV